MMKFKELAFAVMIALLAWPALAGQHPQAAPAGEYFEADVPGVDQGPNGPGPTEEQREEIRSKIEAVRIMRLTEALKLDEKTAASFIPALTALDRKQHELMRENHRVMRELRRELAQKEPDRTRLRSATETIFRNHQAMAKLREKDFLAAKEHLTVEQQARYILFQRDFMREMRGMISGARGARGPGRTMR